MKQRPLFQRVAIDVLGFTLIIVAVPISWIPGPGGIPVLIIGLSLLATNHEWAERLLGEVRERGVAISKKIFSDDPRAKWLLDILSIAFITGAVLIITLATRSLTKTAAISLILAGAVLFFGNRKRFHHLKRRIKK